MLASATVAVSGDVKYRKRSLRIFDHSLEGIRSLGKKAHKLELVFCKAAHEFKII